MYRCSESVSQCINALFQTIKASTLSNEKKEGALIQEQERTASLQKCVEAFIVWSSAFIHWETLSEHVYMFTFIH